GGHEEGRDAHVEEPGHSGGAVVGVEGGEHQVTGESGANANLRRLEVTRLTHEDDVGILAEEGAQAPREGAPDLVVDLDLIDALEVVFHGVFRGHDIDVGRVDGVDGRGGRGGLARAGGTRDENHAVGAVNGLGELVEAPRVEAQHGQVELERVLVENPHDRLLAEDRGQGGDAEVYLALFEAQLDAPALGQPPLRDI